MSCIEFYKCYDFNNEWYLVEMILDIPPSQIHWGEIVVPEKGVDKSNWQCAYMEQYLSSDGREKICETYCEPDEDIKPCRVAFLFIKVQEQHFALPMVTSYWMTPPKRRSASGGSWNLSEV